MMQIIETVRQTIIQFCTGFVENPYLCYTEHGQHALFYTHLYSVLPPEQRYTIWQGQKISVVQKEYPTAGALDKPRRQHWDIAVIKTPAESVKTGSGGYDYLKLAAVVEFGMNEGVKHLEEDIRRLCHQEANLVQGFIVHLYRLSEAGALFSSRDWSSHSAHILLPEGVAELSTGKPVEIYYGMGDSTGKHPSGVWRIQDGEVTSLK
jgi:hypothetical protein